MLAFDTVLFELARLFLWPVTLGVLLSFVYAVYCLGAFGIEYVQRRRDPSRALVLQRHAATFPEIKLFPITAVAKDWTDAYAKYFADGAVFDGIYGKK